MDKLLGIQSLVGSIAILALGLTFVSTSDQGAAVTAALVGGIMASIVVGMLAPGLVLESFIATVLTGVSIVGSLLAFFMLTRIGSDFTVMAMSNIILFTIISPLGLAFGFANGKKFDFLKCAVVFIPTQYPVASARGWS